ncbi:neutral sphingomyelinase activation associated factor-like protein [Leptomonas pyrrhocoris]|uniref:Neutral sphingomyelinase activation associated factor-like protein n=1 Tax=Leptomonas pyrrhocoris TaxID=157538 RepID=A0A0N0DYA9_LEPPY|nr:neutral sphingomyelinase activation associated factor-like protein [Leptomonas pyrrhocoris]KPA83782.1 neutral sphingomyelinase activation associated factor-like protein [Leptomonas pyrrhocoris]|eukprot:XP_015662221.1 neutral sphingomyelinase activation associated factor-like protein [Leptomonas pyrrhocoris]
MWAGASRISLYWLDDHESYLGEGECTRPSTSWLPFGGETTGTLSLATSHIFYDDGSDTLVVFPLRYIENATVRESGDQLDLSFSCRRAVKRAVLPRTDGQQPAAPGVSVPFPNAESWRFRASRASEWFVEALRRLVEHQRMEELLSRREIALQAAPSSVSFRARRQVPMREQRGVLHITAACATFEPLFAMASHGAVSLARSECVHSFPRWIAFEAVGLDIYTSEALDHAPALSLLFNNVQERDQARELLLHLLGVPPYSISPHAKAEAWKRRELSNYDYLLLLNKWASRCFNDVFQYPIFPWVLADYTSAQLDISAPATFRDLRKPIGALSPDRLEMLRERAQFLGEAEERTYLYSTHYSSAGVVAYYLVRPHPEFQLCLQGGILDVAERIMESVPQVWRSVTTNTSNFRELIPEFFNGDFHALCGPPRIALGSHGNGRPVRPFVELPPWAADAHEFVQLHRAALESDDVSHHLHHWIDLIFGAAQSGELARAADNLFHPFSYRQLARKQVSVPGLHLSPHDYAREFGNVPMQLFSDVHPSRNDREHSVLCTVEAVEACGGCDASTSPNDQRIAQMIETLRAMDEETEEPPLCADLSRIEGSHFSSESASLVEVATATLASTGARFATLGFANRTSQDAAMSAGAVLLVVGDDGRVVTLFSAVSGERLRAFPDFDGRTTSTAYHAGSVFVFTDNRTCYVISLHSHAVTHCFLELTSAPVVHACFLPHAVLLADTEAQVMWWAAQRDDTAHLTFDAPPSSTCEASSRILCLGGAARISAAVAVSTHLEAFLFHDSACEECTLRTMPDEREILNAAAADQAPYFWVFFRAEAVLYDNGGLWLRRVPFPAASAVICVCLEQQLCPLCLYTSSLPVRVRLLQHARENVVQLRCCTSVPLCVSYADAALVLVSRTDGGAASSLVLTLAELRLAKTE